MLELLLSHAIALDFASDYAGAVDLKSLPLTLYFLNNTSLSGLSVMQGSTALCEQV